MGLEHFRHVGRERIHHGDAIGCHRGRREFQLEEVEAGALGRQSPFFPPLPVGPGVSVGGIPNDGVRETVEVLSNLVPASGPDPGQDEARPGPIAEFVAVAVATAAPLADHEAKVARGVLGHPRLVLDGPGDRKPSLGSKVPVLEESLSAHQGQVGLVGRRRRRHAFLEQRGGVSVALVGPGQGQEQTPARPAVEAVHQVDPFSHGLPGALQHGDLGGSLLGLGSGSGRFLAAAAPVAPMAQNRRWFAHHEVVTSTIQNGDGSVEHIGFVGDSSLGLLRMRECPGGGWVQRTIRVPTM
mmetsp:Transcript_23214/g.64364  ORF Transcript_23214/g.64364 Transcript_23214/m.64364 type:complete len:298 (-) Transcript_23214:37-930(-)